MTKKTNRPQDARDISPAVTVAHRHGETLITLLDAPTRQTWLDVKRRALITVGKHPVSPPDSAWISGMLEARHSPIRYAVYSFELSGIPSNTATHFCRHVHAQPYVSTLRRDRMPDFDGDAAPRCTPVDMILDVNAEELMVMANKRLCLQAAEVTREIMRGMAKLAGEATPEIAPFLVPMCAYHGGVCHEMNGCGRSPHYRAQTARPWRSFP